MFPALHLTDLSHPALHTSLSLVLAMLCICFHRDRIAVCFASLGVVWIALCATPAFADLLRHGLENPYPGYPASSYPAADAIVVLGGGDPPEFGAAGGREETTRAGFALELYRQGRAPIVLASGGDGEADEIAQQLREQGIPAQGLRVEAASMTTYENAAYSAPLLQHERMHRILLVTSAISMRRAAACFEHQGFDVIAAPALHGNRQSSEGTVWLPQSAVLYDSQRYLHEYIGLLFYKVRGWI